MGEYVVSAGTAEKRMYWLQQLQKCRREFSAGGAAAIRNSVNPHQVNFLQPNGILIAFVESNANFHT